MTVYDWHQQWERAARAEKESVDRQTVAELLDQIARGSYGRYYAIWRSIGARAELQTAGWPLMRVLKSNADFHNRYHCASALLRLMGESPAEAVHYSADIPTRQENLAALEETLTILIGDPVNDDH